MGKTESKTRISNGLHVKVVDNKGLIVTYREYYHITEVPTVTCEQRVCGEGKYTRWQDVRAVDRTEVFKTVADAAKRLETLTEQIGMPCIEMVYAKFREMTMENPERS